MSEGFSRERIIHSHGKQRSLGASFIFRRTFNEIVTDSDLISTSAFRCHPFKNHKRKLRPFSAM